jgi:hypothetical protein
LGAAGGLGGKGRIIAAKNVPQYCIVWYNSYLCTVKHRKTGEIAPSTPLEFLQVKKRIHR